LKNYKPLLLRIRINHILTKLIALFVFICSGIFSAFGQNPAANFTANITSGCAPLTVAFTDQSTGAPTSWNWQFGNGQLSTNQNSTVTYNTPGVYTVKLVVRNANGIDDEEKIDYITVYAAPTAAFSANLTTACVPASIQFTDNSTTPPGVTISEWQWTFGDGGTSNVQNPTHTYNANGFYTVSLTVKSGSGCTHTAVYTNYIRIVSGITTNFTFLPPSTCKAPFVVTLQDQSSGPGTLSYTWNLGNGQNSNQQNPTTIYPAASNYTVQLDVQSNLGCKGSIQKTITIAGTTTDFTIPGSNCIGQILNFQNSSSSNPVSSSWDFGDGTTSGQINPIKTYLAAGTYQVRLINQYANCTDSVTKPVTVIDKPVVDFTANDTASCSAPFTVQFTDNTTGATGWLWDFGDGSTSTQQNPSHQYNTLGDYSVTLTVTSGAGCSNTLTKKDYILIRKTTVDISNVPTGGCVPFTFKPLPVITTVDDIVSYNWDLGEPGAVYTTQFPTHVYNTPGTYPVKLTVTTQSGCVATVMVVDSVKTGTPPTVNFSYSPTTPICASTPINFTDLSTTTPGADVQWNWDFGDNTNSTAQNPTHIFKDTGSIIVKLEVSNNGCIGSVSQTLQILPPVANFGYKLDCNNRKQVTFIDSSLTNIIYGPITYVWQMGDPANTTIPGAAPPTFTYPGFGVYNVTLTVTNGPCSYTITKQIKVSDDKADFSINKNPVCKNDQFLLKAINSDSALITSYTWTIGSDPPLVDTTRSIAYSISTNGNYDVTLTLLDNFGCVLTKTAPAYIDVIGPVAGFVPVGLGGCADKVTTFNDLTTSAAPIAKWEWDFGDGTQQTYTSPPFTHTYTQAGSYTVSLKVTDNIGCADSYSNAPLNLLVTNSKVGFRADTIYCPSAPLQFTDTSSGPILSYVWSFSDGGSASFQNPKHAFPNGDADYTVKLKITDAAGCQDSVTKTNYIKIRKPKPAFILNDTVSICPPLVSRFTFQGQDYKSLLWDFGDGATSTFPDPVHFYNQYGTYIPKLYLIGNGGCIDSAESKVNVYNPSGSVQINFNPATSCNSVTANFNIVSPPTFKFQLFFGDGTSDTSQQRTLSHFYKSPGNFMPYIYLYDSSGCVISVSSPIPVYVYGAIPLFGKDKKEFCDQGDVTFSNFTLNNDPVISNTWDFGDGSTSTTQSPVHNFSSPGLYSIKLNVVTQNQCASSFTDTIRVYRTPLNSITSRDTLCLNMAEQFKGVLTQPDTSINWQWNFGNGSSSSQQNSTVTYGASGNFSVQVTATNKIGCFATSTKNIYVAPLPTATAITDPLAVISGSGTNLNMKYTGNIISYLWTPQLGLDCFDCPIPFATPRTTTKYTVAVQDKYSCVNKGNVTVQVVCDNRNFFIPNTFSPNSDGSNDIFYPRGQGIFRIKSLRIFNRWGEMVFENREFQANDASAGWNGMYKGKKVTPDVYVYQIEIYCTNDQIFKLAGNVALIQ